MDDRQFQEEIGKYKIIRRADHYKPRSTGAVMKASATKDDRSSSAPSSQAKKSADIPEPSDFWAAIRMSMSSTLSESELNTFMIALRQEQSQVAKKVNLDDLEEMCTASA